MSPPDACPPDQPSHCARRALHRRTWGGSARQEAYAGQIVDQAVPVEAVRSTAIEPAQAHAAKAGPTLSNFKTRLYAPVLAALRNV